MGDKWKNEWRKLASNYINNESLIEQLYGEIEEHYSDKNRFYHNLEHIASMLDAVHLFKNKMLDYDSVLFAIWYHDIIYYPVRSDNEEKSAAFASKALKKLGLKNDRIRKVNDMIIKTKNHAAYGDSEDYDTQLFLDCDLLILGSERHLYKNYMEHLRKEYHLVPDIIYNKKRRRFLKKFLDREFIYRASEYRNSLENKARENLKFEIETLT